MNGQTDSGPEITSAHVAKVTDMILGDRSLRKRFKDSIDRMDSADQAAADRTAAAEQQKKQTEYQGKFLPENLKRQAAGIKLPAA